MARGSLSSKSSTALARPATAPDAPASQLVQDTTEPQRSAFWADGTLGVGAAFGGMGGFSNVFSRGVYETYRLMNHDPTLALARAMAKLPIKAATHSFEADDDVPDHVVEAVQKAVDPLWGDVVDTMCWALEYGWKSAELIWEYQGGMLVPKRVKPLEVDTTQILVDSETGSYLGIRQGAVDLMRGKSLYFGNDVEDQNYYGQSRHENVRRLVWGPWQDLMKRMHTYFAKGAGVIPVVRYPIGTGADENGANDDNFKRARSIIDTLSGAAGVCFPFEATKQAIDAAIRSGGKLTDLAAWTIDFLESKAGHGAEFGSTAEYYDKLKFRGWLVPERAGMEGQHGTKAEAETHGDVGVGCAEETHKGICLRVGNEQLVNPFLAYNFGPQMEGKVRMVPAPLVDDTKALVRDIVKSVLTNASAVDVLLTLTDFDAMLDQAGVPKGKQTVDPAELLRAKEQGDPNADPDAPEDGGDKGPPKPGKPKKPMSPADQQKSIAASMERIHDALMRGGTRPTRRGVRLSQGPHKWASAYARLPEPQSAAVLKFGASIPDDQLGEDGRETEPHVTVKYGLGSDDPEAVRAVVEASPPIKVTFGQSSVFSNPTGDVLKFDVFGDGLRALNDAIDKAVPHVDTHEWYQPHATVAYLKPGTGQLYAGDKSLDGQEAVIDRLVFSDRAGRKTEIMLKGPTGTTEKTNGTGEAQA